MKWIAAVLACVLFAAPGYAKKILVIESYHKGYPWDKSCREGLESVLGKENSITYFEMDTKRLPKSQHQKMADLAWRKYQQLKPALVMLGDDAALKYLGKKFAKTSFPVVYFGINNNPRAYFEDNNVPSNFTGVLERPIFKRSIFMIKNVLPNAKKGLVLFDTDITSKIVLSEVFMGEKNHSFLGLQINVRLVEKYDQWQQIIKSAKGVYDFVVLGLYQTLQNKSGAVVNSDEVITWTSKNTAVPVFGFWDFSVGSDKSIGGVVLCGKDMGIKAGKIAQKILSGMSPHEVFSGSINQGMCVYSKSQLKKWHISVPENLSCALR